MTETRTYAERRFTSEDGLDLYARDYAGADGQARLPVIAILGGLSRHRHPAGPGRTASAGC